MRARDVLGPDGPLARAISGYEHRPSQLAMADAVERALADDGLLLVEAGTGTGKTLAYLVPAILSGKKVVVSTGTKTLQDQIFAEDLPLLAAHLDVPVEAARMKGLGNYLCLRRYEELLGSPESVSDPALARTLPVLRDFRDRTLTGDRAELATLAEDAAIWSHVCSGSDTRIGSRCRHFDACFVTKMRRDAEAARLIVVNHHLFFADLATRGPHGGGIIPDYDAVIFDEAHQIEDVATDFFGVQVSTTRVEQLVRDAQRALTAVGLGQEAGRMLTAILTGAQRFFGALPRPSVAIEGSRAPLSAESFSGELLAAMHALDAALEALESYARKNAGASEAVAQTARRAMQLRNDVAHVAEGEKSTRVTWAQARGRRVSIGASPVDVSELFRERVLYQTRGVVLTSATLSTAGSFEFIEKRLGIDFPPMRETLPSPFDYTRQAALYLPDLPDPRDAAYAPRAADEIVALVSLTGGGAFVLCTSVRAMEDLARRCRPRLAGTSSVLLQGEAPKPVLLDRFRADGHAVLFATASFWEGVDVPGEALRLVVIDKLPFDVPSDPLVAARCKRMEDAGEPAFMSYVVPAAALALKQGFGRLIRTARDRGIVAVLDRRLTKKGYGRVFLRSLPDARRCTTREELHAFWNESSAQPLLSPAPTAH